MGVRGKGRHVRQGFLDEIRAEDPALADRLEELRTRKPQAYRKRLRAMARERGFRVAIGGRWLRMGPTPGRETDPEARIGPEPVDERMERKKYLFTPGRETHPDYQVGVPRPGMMVPAPVAAPVAEAVAVAPEAVAAVAPEAAAPVVEAAAPKKARAKKK